jgi:hypothetical protein
MLKQGTNWSLEYDDSVLIARFEEGIDYDAFGDEAFPAFQEILNTHGTDIVASANLVAVEDHLDEQVYDVWEAAADEYAQLPNYKRGAFVAEGIKKFSLKQSLAVPDATNKTFDAFDSAVEWARHG